MPGENSGPAHFLCEGPHLSVGNTPVSCWRGLHAAAGGLVCVLAHLSCTCQPLVAWAVSRPRPRETTEGWWGLWYHLTVCTDLSQRPAVCEVLGRAAAAVGPPALHGRPGPGCWLSQLRGGPRFPVPSLGQVPVPCFCCRSGSWPTSSHLGLGLPTGESLGPRRPSAPAEGSAQPFRATPAQPAVGTMARPVLPSPVGSSASPWSSSLLPFFPWLFLAPKALLAP